jgi:hypothetical protein
MSSPRSWNTRFIDADEERRNQFQNSIRSSTYNNYVSTYIAAFGELVPVDYQTFANNLTRNIRYVGHFDGSTSVITSTIWSDGTMQWPEWAHEKMKENEIERIEKHRKKLEKISAKLTFLEVE